MHGRSLRTAGSIHKVVVLCLFLVPLCAAKDWQYEETRHDAREFVAGGFLHVRMTVGDIHIKRGDSTKIKLEYTIKSKHENNVKEATANFDVHDNNASIEFHAPSSGNTQFDVVLEVPQNTNIDVHQKVGDVTVDDVDGDKDLDLGVGDIRVERRARRLSAGERENRHRRRSWRWIRRNQRMAGEDLEVSR